MSRVPTSHPAPAVRRRVPALLAGALVLGIGATATAAAWNDQERAAGSFRAGVFATQSQGTDGLWAPHPAGSPASLTLTGTLAPGGTGEPAVAGPPAFAWLNVRTTDASDLLGLVGLEAVEVTGPDMLAPALEYRVVERAASQSPCTADDFDVPGAWFLAGGADHYQPLAGTPAATGGPVTVGQDGTGLCVQVRLAASAAGADAGAHYQGAQSALTFRFSLVSTTSHGSEQP